MSASNRAARKSERNDSQTPFEKQTEGPLLLLSLAIIPLLLLSQVMDVSSTTDQAVEIALWVILAIFILELTIRTSQAKDKLEYLVDNWFDVLLVVTPPVFFLASSPATFVNFLRPLRIARSARAFGFFAFPG